MIQNLHLLRCYRSCLVANKLHEAKRTNIRNYTAKLHQTTMNNTVKYMLRYATLRNDTKNNKQTKKNVRRCDLQPDLNLFHEMEQARYLTEMI